MKYINKLTAILSVGLSVALGSCSDSFLEPDPLSFFEPTTTFTNEAGLAAALGQIDRNLKMMYVNTSDLLIPVHTQFLFSDMVVLGATDNTTLLMDFSKDFVPSKSSYSAQANQAKGHACVWFWNEFYNGIKYANTVIEFAPQVKSLDEGTLNAYVGRAYFHRSFRYYGLVNMFGNVPLITKMPQSPKRNYSSTSREAILKMIQEDMEFAVKWVPDQQPASYTSDYPGGYVNKAACRMLLAKIYMANYEYAKAKEQLDILIDQSGYSLMTEPFGTNILNATKFPGVDTWNVNRNVIWDLHRTENVFDGANRETIMGMANGLAKNAGYTPQRVLSPFVFNNQLKDPDGKQGLINYSQNNRNSETDWVRVLGRGVCEYRPTTWAQYDLWSLNGQEADKGDLRHSSEAGNWLNMEDMTYNNKDSKYYGQHLRLFDDNGNLLCADTIRRWYNVPLYKLYNWDYNNFTNKNSADWRGPEGVEAIGHFYLYRLAEAYLLRAECKLYLGQDGTEDVNTVRRRAHCEQIYTSVTIDDIFDERARELYLEEFRHDELVRASFCLANTGVADRKGNVYKMEDIFTPSDDTGKTGGSYWYQRVIGACPDENHIGYNNGVTYNISANNAHPRYVMGKHNIFWPIPEFAIEDNDLGQLYQNYGYDGYDSAIHVFTDWKEAVEDELK